MAKIKTATQDVETPESRAELPSKVRAVFLKTACGTYGTFYAGREYEIDFVLAKSFEAEQAVKIIG